MIQGVVQKIIDKEWGETKFYSFFLKGQDGLYSLGEHSPTFKVGDSIKFEVKQKGKYLYAQDIVPWTGDGVQTAPAVGATVSRQNSYSGKGSFKGNAKKDEYWDEKEARDIERERYQREVTQPRIEIQAARNAAIEAARFLIEKEFVKTPTKQADKYDTYLALVNQLTDEFIKNTAGRLEGQSSRSSGSTNEGAVETNEGTSSINKNDGSWD
jgi:hypothetical protein